MFPCKYFPVPLIYEFDECASRTFNIEEKKQRKTEKKDSKVGCILNGIIIHRLFCMFEPNRYYTYKVVAEKRRQVLEKIDGRIFVVEPTFLHENRIRKKKQMQKKLIDLTVI